MPGIEGLERVDTTLGFRDLVTRAPTDDRLESLSVTEDEEVDPLSKALAASVDNVDDGAAG